MAAAGPSNILARQVTDDLIDFSDETSLPKYMKFFFLEQIAKTRHDCSITETASMNNDSHVDVSSLGGLGTKCHRQRFASFTPAICAKPS
ncbi:hypothetical protein Tco_0567394 [Tanacetum coccineum]